MLYFMVTLFKIKKILMLTVKMNTLDVLPTYQDKFGH